MTLPTGPGSGVPLAAYRPLLLVDPVSEYTRLLIEENPGSAPLTIWMTCPPPLLTPPR